MGVILEISDKEKQLIDGIRNIKDDDLRNSAFESFNMELEVFETLALMHLIGD